MPKIETDTAIAPNPAPAKAPGKKPRKPAEAREVLHPEPMAVECWGDKALTPDKCKELLGWVAETEGVDFGSDYHLKDREGRKVRLENSAHNRPFDTGLANQYAQELLNLRWKLNGENVIRGKYGEILSGQHRLGGVVLAEQDRQAEEHWQENWPGPVCLNTFMAVGVEEDDETVNTLDTGKPRSFADVLYRSQHFADLPPAERKPIARIASYAIKGVEKRTGANKDSYSPNRTHAESLYFLDCHKTLMACIRHVYSEDKGGNISSLVSPGLAASLMYMMAQGRTDPSQYQVKVREGVRKERYLDLSLLERAKAFWVELSQSAQDKNEALKAVVRGLGALVDPETNKPTGTPAEKIYIICKGWLVYADGGTPTAKDVKLEYGKAKDENTAKPLKNVPTFGGVDMPEEEEETDDAGAAADEDGDEEAPQTPEELAAELAKTYPERVKQKLLENREKVKANKAAKAAANGEQAKPKDDPFTALQATNPDKLLLFKSRSGGYSARGEQADVLIKVAGIKSFSTNGGVKTATFPEKMFEEVCVKLLDAGHKVSTVEERIVGAAKESKLVVTDV